MESTLKVTNVLSDPTRFNIYQYIIKHHKPVTVLEVAGEFDIHPNVARLHLSKLEEIKLIISHFQKTGKGGRPSRLYQLSENVVELNFPHRDYKLLANIAVETITALGDVGKETLYNTAKKYGTEVVNENYQHLNKKDLTIPEKIQILKEASKLLGMYPEFEYDENKNNICFKVNNCPFKEIIGDNKDIVCGLHQAFLQGMFDVLFAEIELIETENMFDGCDNCEYFAKVPNPI